MAGILVSLVVLVGCMTASHQVDVQKPTPSATPAITLVTSYTPVQKTTISLENSSEKPIIVQSEEIIRKFADIPDQNLTFKGIMNGSYADLYEFKSGNSSFWINNVTGRVQSALLSEAGSKTQNEIIDLDEGFKTAESYAKEKYPELWNISDKKGIKQTVKRINDRGLDRVFEYSWREILYNPDKNTTSQSEIPGQNYVYVTVSSYTGHVISYHEWYQGSESYPDLIPTLTEEQARKYAGSHFQRVGVTDFQPTEMESSGLRVITDQKNNQRLVWDFTLTKKSKNGFDKTWFVGIDANDGHVVWYNSIT